MFQLYYRFLGGRSQKSQDPMRSVYTFVMSNQKLGEAWSRIEPWNPLQIHPEFHIMLNRKYHTGSSKHYNQSKIGRAHV